jgi:hypothetical protein
VSEDVRNSQPGSTATDLRLGVWSKPDLSGAATIDGTLSSASSWGMIGFEIKHDTAGPSILAMVQQPSTAASGVANSPSPSCRLQTAAAGNVSRAGVNVTASIGSGAGVLSGTLTVATDASGVATFSNLIITNGASHTLVFSAADIQPVTSNSFSITGGAVAPTPHIFRETFSGGMN